MNDHTNDADSVTARPPTRVRNAQVKWGSGEIGVKPTARKSKRPPAAFSTTEVNDAVAQFLARSKR